MGFIDGFQKIGHQLAKRFSKLTAAPAVAALVVGFRRHVIVLAFGLFRMPQRSTRAIEWLRLGRRYVDNRIDQFEKLTIRRLFVKIVSLVANGITLAAFHPMIVVIEHFLERTALNHGLIALETFALFPFERLDRYGTKLDPLHRPPRIEIAFENLDSVKTRPFKRG